MVPLLQDFFRSSPLEKDWKLILKDFLLQEERRLLINSVHKAYTSPTSAVYPPREQIFQALNLTSFTQTKVVIVGQDPYHGPGQAEGLAFSVQKDIPLPPSLQNIFKELKTDIGIPYPPSHGSLVSWAKQGVLLLNATLTVEAGKPLSHHGIGWESFTDHIIFQLSQRQDPLIFVLWGKSAQEKCRFLTSTMSRSHQLLLAPHPSPFSANRGFFGCRHFSKINQLLSSLGQTPILWDNQENKI